MMDRRSLAALLATALLVLAGGAPTAGAEDGMAALTGRDLAARTVTLDDRVFRVTDRTRIEDLEGLAIPLERVPEPAKARSELFFAFESVDRPGGPVLVSLRQVPVPE